MSPTFLSVFSGIGGFDRGLEQAGWSCIGQIEIDPFCNRVLQRHWRDVVRGGDVCGIRLEDGRLIGLSPSRITKSPGTTSPSTPDLQSDALRITGQGGTAQRVLESGYTRRCTSSTDWQQRTARPNLLCGGFPCQDLSVAGKRAGLAGKRSGLFFEFMRLARQLSPRWLLLENVPGLLSSAHGRDFTRLLYELEQSGYGWAYRVLDSRWFGVAQRRRRVFIVGHLGGSVPPAILFEPEGHCGDSEESREAGQDVAYCLNARPESGSRYGPGWSTTYALIEGDSAYSVQSTGAADAVQIAQTVRRLTPLEAERLQAFPDGWTCLCGCHPYSTVACTCPDSPRYRALGNAVTVNVITWIGQRLLDAHQRSLHHGADQRTTPLPPRTV